MTYTDLESDPNLSDPQAAWDFIQQAILNEYCCHLDQKEWHLQNPDVDPIITGVVEVVYVHKRCYKKNHGSRPL